MAGGSFPIVCALCAKGLGVGGATETCAASEATRVKRPLLALRSSRPSLTNVLSQVGCIPERPLANIVFQALWGLAYLRHEKRVHRDVKPSNILLSSRGVVKLTDFGLATALDGADGSAAACRTWCGTLRYMAPERVCGGTMGSYGYASDVWALGLVVFECATGLTPYVGGGGGGEGGDVSVVEMIQTIRESPSPSLPRGTFSPGLCELVDLCLRKDPTQRMPADLLLGSPWLRQHGATSLDAARETLRLWIADIADVAAAGAAPVTGPARS
jgi:serine/threonine protein kinase